MTTTPDFQPLYKQVYGVLVRRIADGDWRPAEVLPSEQALASELGVSQGTVRKALDTMAAEKLVERRQGKGTFVAEHTQELALFRFFRLVREDGSRVTPTSTQRSVRRRAARPGEISQLRLRKGAQVVEIQRTRHLDDVPTVLESIIVPHALFPDIDQRGELPNTLYSLYQSEYGISVVAAEEQLRADAVTKDDTTRLNMNVGEPLLRIDRIAVALDGARVEWRISRCDTRNFVYGITVS